MPSHRGPRPILSIRLHQSTPTSIAPASRTPLPEVCPYMPFIPLRRPAFVVDPQAALTFFSVRCPAVVPAPDCRCRPHLSPCHLALPTSPQQAAARHRTLRPRFRPPHPHPTHPCMHATQTPTLSQPTTRATLCLALKATTLRPLARTATCLAPPPLLSLPNVRFVDFCVRLKSLADSMPRVPKVPCVLGRPACEQPRPRTPTHPPKHATRPPHPASPGHPASSTTNTACTGLPHVRLPAVPAGRAASCTRHPFPHIASLLWAPKPEPSLPSHCHPYPSSVPVFLHHPVSRQREYSFLLFLQFQAVSPLSHPFFSFWNHAPVRRRTAAQAGRASGALPPAPGPSPQLMHAL